MLHTNKRKYAGKLVIGITGGAGSGKSTIVEYIKSKFSVEFIHCDVIAHELMEPGGATYFPLIEEYGKEILEDNSEEISTARLLAAVKESNGGFERLNAITHPIVIQESLRRIDASDKKIILIEAALLLEAGMDKICDDVWYIHSTKEERIARIKASRNWSEEKIKALLENQLSDAEFAERCTYTIENHDGSSEGKVQAYNRIIYLDEKE